MTSKSSVVRGPKAALAAVLCLLLGMSARAGITDEEREKESSDSPSSSARATPTVDEPLFYETATVEARPLTHATATVTVVDREAIESLNVTTVAEVISYIPGIYLSHSGPQGGFAAAQIRGGDPNFTVVLLDGVPLNDSTDQFGGAVNLNSLPASQVERIEVVRQPISSFYGSAGLAGVINIITRRGQGPRPTWSVELTGGNDSLTQAAASLSRATDRAEYFVGLNWQQVKGQVADDSFEQFLVLGNARFELDESSALNITGRATSWKAEDYREGSGGPVFGSGETRVSDHEELSLGVDLELGLPERRHRIYTTLYRHDLDRESPAIGFLIPASTESTRYTDWRLGWNFPAKHSQHTRLSVGAEIGHQDGKNESVLIGLGPGDYELDRTIGAAHLEFLTEWGPVLFEVGARLDLPEGFDTEFSPRVGVNYRFDDHGRLHASFGRAFKLPSFFTLGTPPALGGNPDLEPESSEGGDLGVQYSFDRQRLTAELTLFYYQYKDLIDFDFGLLMLVNRDEVDSRGAELAVGWKASERIDLRINFTRQDVEDSASGEPLRNRPDWIGGARFNWRIGSRVRWGVDGQWISGSRDQQIPVPALDSVSGYQLYGSTVRVALGPRWEVNGRLDNIFDEEYETSIGFPAPGRRFKAGLRFTSR